MIVGLVEVSRAHDEFGFIVAFETGAGHDIEDPVGAVAEFGAVAAAIGLHIFQVFGIELRANILCDIGVVTGIRPRASVVWWPPRM